MTHSVTNPTPIIHGVCQDLYALPAQLGELCASSVPKRAITRLMPKAKLSSFPRNHLARAVVTETISDSAPMPKMKRPLAMTPKRGVAAVRMAPARQMVPNRRVALRVPMRSMITPPMSTVAMGAML